jgi:hypothetical protein
MTTQGSYLCSPKSATCPWPYLPLCFFTLSLNIILPCMSTSFKLSLSDFSTNTLSTSLHHMCHIPQPCYTPWFDHPNNISWLPITKLINTNFRQHPVPSSSLLSLNIFFGTLCSSLMWKTKFHSNSIITVLYILIFIFLESKQTKLREPFPEFNLPFLHPSDLLMSFTNIWTAPHFQRPV